MHACMCWRYASFRREPAWEKHGNQVWRGRSDASDVDAGIRHNSKRSRPALRNDVEHRDACCVLCDRSRGRGVGARSPAEA